MKLTNFVEIHGILNSEQGNKKAQNSWIRKLYEATKTSDGIFVSDATAKIQVQFISDYKEVNDLLVRMNGFMHVSEIKFPLNDVPEQPKCMGSFDREQGIITHFDLEACPIHKIPEHTHKEVS